jgi:hypothetical protein
MIMQMQAADIAKFPRFAAYVSVKMPEVTKVDTIISAIHKYAGAVSKSVIKDALLWGQGPIIKIVSGLTCSGGAGAVGCFRFGTASNEVEIEEWTVKDFEAGKGLRKTPKGQMVYLVGAILLHELTHWADDQDSVDDPPFEEGDAFTRDVYGGVITFTGRIA